MQPSSSHSQFFFAVHEDFQKLHENSLNKGFSFCFICFKFSVGGLKKTFEILYCIRDLFASNFLLRTLRGHL